MSLQELSPEQLGFDLKDEVPAEMTPEDEKDVSKVRRRSCQHIFFMDTVPVPVLLRNFFFLIKSGFASLHAVHRKIYLGIKLYLCQLK